LVCAAAAVISAPRWLRLAQREHYIPGRVRRFASRWWLSTRNNQLLLAGLVLGGMSALALPFFAVVCAAVAVAAPLGLGLRGRTSKLMWTRRLKTTAAVAAVIDALAFAAAIVAGDAAPGLAAMLLFLQPAVVDLALLITAPFERRAARNFVRSATQKLRATNPITVAITGSYGKTSTKLYARHLIAGSRSVLASPASFNNTGGLSRTLNEHLVPGTEVFIAEMGMYGPGEIRAMCEWVQPKIGVIVNIGPVHLERVGSLDGIVAAKSEILEHVDVAVLNVSAHGLARLADRLEQQGTRVVRVSTDDTPARVAVIADGDGNLDCTVDGRAHRIEDTAAQPANVAAALGIAVAFELPMDAVLPRLDSLPQPEHRQAVEVSPNGVVIIDNTFSSNPASASTSLELLERLTPRNARAVVVTPGMIELGREQYEENRKLAELVDDVADDLVIVGLTNRAALREGAERRRLQLHLAPTRDQAVEWVRANLVKGDVVLYENDLPDHYP